MAPQELDCLPAPLPPAGVATNLLAMLDWENVRYSVRDVLEAGSPQAVRGLLADDDIRLDLAKAMDPGGEYYVGDDLCQKLAGIIPGHPAP